MFSFSEAEVFRLKSSLHITIKSESTTARRETCDVLEERGEGVELLRQLPDPVPDVLGDVARHLGELADAGQPRQQPEPVELGRHSVENLH